MSAVPSQRWQSVPEQVIPLRSELVAWLRGDAPMVRAFVERQGPAVLAWVKERGGHYCAKYPGEKPNRCWHEAALDLIAWQRGGVLAGPALRWLRAWERAVNDGKSK